VLTIPSRPSKILVVGGGGREHALCWKLAQSHHVSQIFCAPGNGGTASEDKTVNIEIDVLDFPALAAICRSEQIDLVVVGPDNPLAEGIVDFLTDNGLRVFGPIRQAAKLEWSKSYAKTFMMDNAIPTPRFVISHNEKEALAKLAENPWAKVVKVDGLALGKGVYVCQSEEETQAACQEIFSLNKFGKAAEAILLEEKITGDELSLLLLCDGKRFIPLAPSQDYKRRFDNNHGPNTGGMGAYSPVALYTKYQKQIEETILHPLKKALFSKDLQYKGILYIGIIVGKNEIDSTERPQVLEFNARFGDPETQALLPRLASDLLPALWACTEEKLNEITLEWKAEESCTIVAVTDTYPDKSSQGKVIQLPNLPPDSLIFQAGTKLIDDKLVTAGGRILAVTSLATDVRSASERSYKVLEHISFSGISYRRDIAKGLTVCR
jgi:phosphoribosylamine--glycine ligase